jgi:hypothetical protein
LGIPALEEGPADGDNRRSVAITAKVDAVDLGGTEGIGEV